MVDEKQRELDALQLAEELDDVLARCHEWIVCRFVILYNVMTHFV